MPAYGDRATVKVEVQRQKRAKKKLKKVSQAPTKQADRTTATPVVKVRQYAHPKRPAAQKVFSQQTKAAAQTKKRVAVKQAKAVALKQAASRIKVTPHASPDAQDSSRSPAQLRRDASFVARNVRVSRLKANVTADRRRIRAIATGRGGKVIDTSAEFNRQREATKAQTAQRLAPVLKVLEQTTRVNHAIAGGVDAAVTGKDISRAAKRGIQNKDKTTFSTVLKHAGVKNKAVQAVGGFTLDVGTDPTTFITGGTGSAAAKGATKAGERAASKALAKGLTKEQAQRFRERATAQAMKTLDQTKGVTVKFSGTEIPGVRRATAKASKPVRAAGRKATPEKLRAATRGVGADLNPNITPAGATREQSRKAVQATRSSRAKTNEGNRQAVNLAAGLRTQIGEANYNKVVDAIEAGKVGSLPENLRGPAVALRSHFKHVRRVQRRAGIPVADATKSKSVKGYVYRQLTDEAADAKAKAPAKGGGLKPPSSKTRVEKRPMAEVRVAKPGQYREDLHALAGERLAHGTASAAKADLNRRLADLGTPVKRGQVPVIKDGEAVFHVKAGAIREVTDRAELARATAPLALNKKGTRVKGATPKSIGAGRYVVLPKGVVKRAQEGTAPKLKGGAILHGFDKTTSGFKRLALATPGFHVRNLIGDTFQAYAHQPGPKLTGNMRRSGAVLRAVGKQEKAAKGLGRPAPSGKTLKTGKYGEVPLEEVADRLVKAGAARSGYTAGELRELSTSGAKGLKIKKPKSPAAVRRAFLNREDLPRLATAIYHLRQGATWEEAAQKVADVHIDYQHLTSFERNFARRIMPFYTWTARNVPIQTKTLIQRPGKFATYQKIRESAAGFVNPGEVDPETKDLYKQLEESGVKMPGGYEKYLSEWEQRNASVPVTWKGHKFTVSVGLPLGDLNELPGASGSAQAEEWFKKAMSMGNPIAKNPVEWFNNFSFFFRDQIERDTSPYVAAPRYVEAMPKALQEKLGVKRIIDKRSGKRVWGWRGKTDYFFKQAPGIPNYAQQFATEGHDRRGKGPGGKALAFMGVKAVPLDPTSNAVSLAYARQAELQKELAGLRQEGIGKDNPTPEWRKLSDQLKIVGQIAYQGKAKRGDKVLPTQGGPPKLKKNPGFKFDGGGQEFDFSAGSQDFDFG